MSNGKVKWFNSQKGFGFISQENGEDLFVHINEVEGSNLEEGQAVEFEIGQTQKGACAKNVKVI